MAVEYTTSIKKFEKQGEKTGWTYIEVPSDLAGELNPGIKTSFRVKGKIDFYSFEGVSLLPMGKGNFIIPLNANMRKQIRKSKGASVNVLLAIDHKPILAPEWLMQCLKDEPAALKTFDSFTKGHQHYFIKWIESAKTEGTKVKRTARMINALAKGMDFSAMLRSKEGF